LYRSVYQDVPKDYYTLPLEKRLTERRESGYYYFWSSSSLGFRYFIKNPEISADLLDLRTYNL
jgi:2-oxoisovalerate dehydrogenase E1 component